MATGLESRGSARQRVWQFAGVEIFAKSTTASVTLTDGDARFVYLDATAGAYTVTLPASPYEGMQFHFSENAGLATAVEIGNNGKTINGVLGSLTMNLAYAQVVLRYNGTGWILVGRVS